MTETSDAEAGPFKSVLVHVDADYGIAGRVRLSARLAASFDATLIGAAASEEELSAVDMDMPLLAPSVQPLLLIAERTRVEHQLTEAETIFRRNALGMRRLEWRPAHDDKTRHLLAESDAADLIVVGQRESSSALIDGSILSVGRIVTGAGRPVLVVPPNVDDLIASRILIGWKNTREARRAVRDSLPFLRQAKSVEAIRVDEEETDTDPEHLATYLGRHGIICSTDVRLAKAAEAPEALLDVAAKGYFDLLVTGAYGHGRRREAIFGGMTRHLIEHSPICCLMSN